MLFYTNVCGNVESEFLREEIDVQLRTEFVSALAPSLGKLSALEIRPNQIVTHMRELEDAINDELAQKWAETRGLKVVSIAMNPPTLPPEDAELIKSIQKNAVLRDTSMAAAVLTQAQADALKTAAGNESGAMMGFMGMNMASNAGAGLNTQQLYAMAQAQKDTWKCSCGATAEGNFCPECGKKKIENSWKCACGNVNEGKFCTNCGEKKPSEGFCGQCGAKVDGNGKFCPECGNKLN